MVLIVHPVFISGFEVRNVLNTYRQSGRDLYKRLHSMLFELLYG